MISKTELIERQSWPLPQKIDKAISSIEEFYNHFDGKVYVSFSGGKDSTVLLDLVRMVYPDVVAVFVDTGLEYPEIRDFVKTIDNVIWVKPRKTFKQVITEYGFPVVSKKVSMGVSRYRGTKSEEQKKLRLFGGINPTSGKKQHPTVTKKWHYLVDADFKISDKCCDHLKKDPLKRFGKKHGLRPIIGSMTVESTLRTLEYLKHGCNAFDKKGSQSNPLSIWTEEDIWEYIKLKNLPYSKIYDMGYQRTGCMFCMFGVQNDDNPNRFEQMAETHPKQYDYCINKLGLKKPLDFMNVKY